MSKFSGFFPSTITFFILIIFLASCQIRKDRPNNVLVFTKTEGYRHASIETGVELIKKLGIINDFTVEHTEEASVFNDVELQKYGAVIFLSTTGDILNEKEQVAFHRYITAGGSFLGVHAATDTEYKWPWYGRLVGGYFNGHPSKPNVRKATIEVLDSGHESCSHLPSKWEVEDEWYNYKNLNPRLNVLLNLDEGSYEGGTNGSEHPIAWWHDFDGGRAFYTGLGHTTEAYQDSNFIAHLSGGINHCLSFEKELDYNADHVLPEENRIDKQVFEEYLSEPMELDVLPNNDILFIERKGRIKVYNQKTRKTEEIEKMDVYEGQEDGLLGLAIDPDFKNTNWIYLYYSPSEDTLNRLSRFTLTLGDNAGISDEKVMLEVVTQRNQCCHAGGSIEFGPDSLLYLSAGDDTNPFASNGYGPMDEREDRKPWDAQRTSANSQDLRGKVMRIKPESDGTYSIPSGNLFKNPQEGRPEIYAMGCRNPFRISIDQRENILYWGDVGPDAGNDSKTRGPKGHDEVNQAKEAGFFGWPYFVGDNKAYLKFDFDKWEPTDYVFDSNNPINNSPNNSGIVELPPAQKAFIYYPYADSEEFPLLGSGSRNAMAGPIYYFADYEENEYKLPAYYDGKFFAYDWTRSMIYLVTFGKNMEYDYMEPFMPSYKWGNLIDIAVGKDGTFYTLEYGRGWYTTNKDARLSKLTYNKGNRKPKAILSVDKKVGALPLDVAFNGEQSFDYDEEELTYAWDFGDGNISKEVNPTHQYTEAGKYNAALTISDQEGNSNIASISILAGNEPPQIDFEIEGNSTFYWPKKPFLYKVHVNDKEDGSLGAGIIEEDVKFNVDYMDGGFDLAQITMGHQENKGDASVYGEGIALMEASDCASCHKKEEKSIGPSYFEIANKYNGNTRKINEAATRIINGSTGVWGDDGAMAAHPNILMDDALIIMDYIASLAADEEKLPLNDEYMPVIPEKKKPNGVFALLASYIDKGADGAEKLEEQEVKYLINAKIEAALSDTLEVAEKYEFVFENEKGDERKQNVIRVKNESNVGYSNFDLTWVKAIELLFHPMDDNLEKPEIYVVIGEEEIKVDFNKLDYNKDRYVALRCQLIKKYTGIQPIKIKFKNGNDKWMGYLKSVEFKI